MARILVHIRDEETNKLVTDVLTREGHTSAGRLDIPEPADSPVRFAAVIVGLTPDLVLTDYIADDAFSVKVMQEVIGRAAATGFLFFMDRDPGLNHLAMAMNEGAQALLAPPVSADSLKNYISRALTRRRNELARTTELDRIKDLIEKEKTCSLEQTERLSRINHRTDLCYRLIGRLLGQGGPVRGNAKVLLVSDSAYQVDLFKKHLEDHNFPVVTAPDGKQGLEAARREKPRIIVSDLEMPGLNGLEFCRKVKNDENLGPNHFIICTANENKVDEVLRPENKVDDCLVKPSRPEEFREFTARVALGLLS